MNFYLGKVFYFTQTHSVLDEYRKIIPDCETKPKQTNVVEIHSNKQLKQTPMASAPTGDQRMPASAPIAPPEGAPQAVAPVAGAPLGTN